MMDDRSHTTKRTGRPGRPARYEHDLYGWALEQAALLRAGRIEEADVRNIAEELDDVGSEQYDKLASALRIILIHLLKWDHQPGHRSRSWLSTIIEQQDRLRDEFEDSEVLRNHAVAVLAKAYERALRRAEAETGLTADDPVRFGAGRLVAVVLGQGG